MKKVLFVIESLELGGAEKSLVTLLNLIDYSSYQVDLLLFSQGGPFQKLLPKEVNLLPLPDYFQYTSIPWYKPIKKISRPRFMLSQIRYSLKLRIGKHTSVEEAVLFWESCKNCFPVFASEYDCAVAYAQGTPTFFVADTVKAKRKVAWINATYIPTGRYLDFIKPMYERFDFVNAVSETVRNQMQKAFGIPSEKSMMMMDILDVNFARKMAEEESTVQTDMNGEGIKLLTVGRLDYMKGYDLAIDAAAILAKQKINFTWYVIGNGAIRDDLENRIKNNNLQNNFILLGSRPNPYPYFQSCDIYVQTSRYEGFGITLAEAKMFSKPIVTTNFEAVSVQFRNEENGIITDITPEAIAEGIVRMIEDDELRERCIDCVKNEKISNLEEIQKLYTMIGE